MYQGLLGLATSHVFPVFTPYFFLVWVCSQKVKVPLLLFTLPLQTLCHPDGLLMATSVELGDGAPLRHIGSSVCLHQTYIDGAWGTFKWGLTGLVLL